MKIEKKIISLVLTSGIALSGAGIVSADNEVYWGRQSPQINNGYGHRGRPNNGYPIYPEVQPNPVYPNKPASGEIRMPYVVQDGDNPTSVARKVYGSDTDELIWAWCYDNGITDTKNLQIGKIVRFRSQSYLRKLKGQYTVINHRYVYNKNNVPKNLPNSNNANNNTIVTIDDDSYDESVTDITPVIIYIPEEEIPKEELAIGIYKGVTYNCDLSDNYVYVVKKGDTLNRITSRHYGEMGEYHLALRNVIEAINDIKNPDNIGIGQVLAMPNKIILIINDNVIATFYLQNLNNVRTLRP